MTKHNREMLELIRNVKMELKIEALIAKELGSPLNLEAIHRLNNLYGFLDIEDLLTSDYESRILLKQAQDELADNEELNELVKELRK